jgi:hypothetical protein
VDWGHFLDENQTGMNLAVILPLAFNDEIGDRLARVNIVANVNYAE